MREGIYNEKACIQAAIKGDKAAFGKLVCAYQRRAYAVAYTFVRNRDDALELSQDAFVKAFKAMNTFDAKLPFYPWLYRIIRNTCLNHIKRKNRRGESSLDSMMDNGYDAVDTDCGPQERSEHEELKLAIARALTYLTPEQQEILRLRHFLELSYSEIAECLEIPQGTVMSRLHSARKSLRKAIEEKETQLVNV